VLGISPLIARLLPRLVYQLVPAVLVTAVGVLLLSNVAKVSDSAPTAAPVETAINTEAVFRIVPREPAEPEAKPEAKNVAASRPAANPKPSGANTSPARKPVNEPATRQVASVPAPLPIVPITEQPTQPAPPPSEEKGVMAKLRGATAAVQRLPQWAASSVAGWFSESAPPRPPEPVPVQDFQASM
jgi:hypothetical protein